MARKGGQWSDHLSGGRGLQRAAPRDAPRGCREVAGHRVQGPARNADKFQHNKDLTDRRVKAVDAGAFRAPTNAARSFNPQYGDVQRLGAVDSMTVRSTEGRETLLNAAGQATWRAG